MITVNEVMSTQVMTLNAADNVSTAWELMKDQDVRHIPIVDENHFPVGIITERDILRARNSSVLANNQSMGEESILLEQIMSKKISYTRPEDPLRSAGLKLQKNKYGCLPVMDNDKLVGIITDSDFVDIALNLIEQMDYTEETE